MIGIDTNVLVRVFIDDEPAQTLAARRLVAAAATGELLISIVVLVEFIWTLRAIFKVEKADLVAALDGVMTGAAFVLEDRADVEAALQRYKAGRIDIADCLIAGRNRRLGAVHTVSFDRGAIRNGLFRSVQP